MWRSGHAGRFALTIVRILVYGLRIDVWPDDWAASLVTNGRARFRHSPKSLNREAGHEGSCAESHVHTLDEGNFHDYGHRKVLQRPKRLRLHSAGQWREGRVC